MVIKLFEIEIKLKFEIEIEYHYKCTHFYNFIDSDYEMVRMPCQEYARRLWYPALLLTIYLR